MERCATFTRSASLETAFGERPVLKLMFAALIRAAERWRGLRFTEFEGSETETKPLVEFRAAAATRTAV
jgi:hypothetical protein